MINIIGTIYKTIETDDSEVFETEAQEGWHVNATYVLDGLDEFRVYPATPYNVFAGVPTYFYTFASEEEAQENGIGVAKDTEQELDQGENE